MPDHIINKEIFEFTYSDTEYAFALQKQMNSGLQYKMQSLINHTLDSFNEDVETIRLDKLEIDLGKIPFEQLENMLPAKFQTEFKEKLYSAIFEKDPFKNKTIDKRELSDNVSDQLELLEIFLLSGSLPWWAGRAMDFSLKDVILLLVRKDPASLKSLLYKYINDEKITARLFYQTDTNTCFQIMELLGVTTDHISIIKNSLQKLIPSLFGHSSSEQIKNIFYLLVRAIPIHDVQLSIEQKQEWLSEKIKEIFDYSIVFNTDDITVELSLNDIYSVTTQLVKQVFQIDLLNDQQVINNENRIDNKEKIYLQNAGLVLISAFLPALFKELKWVEKDKFINKEIQFKAIFLLHYLTTGNTEAPEYTLQLNKILCGLAQEEPIPFSVELTGEEKQEADQLLADIITHWDALKNSLADVLQGSFLIRDGLLSFTNDHWLLQIERIGYDILLDQIPWSWKMIQLDWMETYIETEW